MTTYSRAGLRALRRRRRKEAIINSLRECFCPYRTHIAPVLRRTKLCVHSILVRAHRALIPRRRKRCRLLELPLEIRLMIWELCVPTGGFVAVGLVSEKLNDGFALRVLSGEHTDLSVEEQGQGERRSRRRATELVHDSIQRDEIGVLGKPGARGVMGLGLLRTCRIIHGEATSLIYGTNTFVLVQPVALLHLRKLVPRRYLALMHSINVHWRVDESLFNRAGKSMVRKPLGPRWVFDKVMSESNKMPGLRKLVFYVPGGDFEMRYWSEFFSEVGQGIGPGVVEAWKTMDGGVFPDWGWSEE